MSDYKESQVAGTSWTRCYGLRVENRRNETPYVIFDEESVAALGDKSVQLSQATLRVEFDPAQTFDLYDPATLQPTGQTATHADLYAMLFSAYMSAAKARDAAQQPDPQPTP